MFRGVRVRLIASLALAASLALPACSFANGDPASDILLTEKVYFPNEKVGVDEAKSLKDVVQSANAKGYTIRVALIKDASDLGTVPQLLNQPQKYSEFLGPEIRFAYKGDLLVVMPTGLGITTTAAVPPPAKAIDGMQVEAGGSSNGLAQTAEEAVRKLSAAAGHPLAAPKKEGGGAGTVVIVLVALVLVAVAIGGAYWARRSAPQPGPPAAP